ncbi:hypothetical protein MKW92_021747 [Papaver armeniacum]|nr:hypothetical protein MKW92_021747 [Papaver armeniacum]
MGQALRRSTGKIRSSSLEASAPSVSSQIKNVEKPSISVPIEDKVISNKGETVDHDCVGEARMNTENILEEEKDSGYDAMLSQMVGRIKSKPGGKLEMGETHAKAAEYNNGFWALRGESCSPGTLNVNQIRYILQLHQGKAEDHTGHMDINQMLEKFRFLSLPPEDINKDNMQEGD